jgi:tetratricopeptide (TPR) repeat protein
MVGRADVLGALSDALATAAGGEPQFVLVAGEAGVGKSRLAREFTRDATSSGHRVLWGDCVPLQAGELPYAPIVAALRAVGLPAELTAGADTDATGTANAPARLFELLRARLGRLADETTTVLVIEDVHWADAATQDFLRYLVRNLQDERLLVLVTQRIDEPAASPSLRRILAELVSSGCGQRVDLAPLSLEDTARQVEGIVGAAPDAALVAWVHERAEGNAYFAEELLAARRADGVPGLELPASLRELLLARMAGLDGESKDVLDAVAAAGRDVGHDLLRASTGLSDGALATAIDPLVESHVLVCDRASERYAFRHALAREAVYAELLPARRRALHSALASSLSAITTAGERDSAVWAALAQHHHAAHEAAPALRASLAAAEAASAIYAYRAACTHLDRARALWSEVPAPDRPDGVDEAEVLRRLADVRRLAGDRDGAIPVAERALALIDPEAEPLRAAAVHAQLGILHRNQAHALRELDRALSLLPTETSAERAEVLASHCYKARFGRRPSETRDAALETLAVAQTAGARAAEGRAREVLGFALIHGGDPDPGIAHLREAIEIAGEVGRGDALAGALNALGDALMLLGRTEEALATMESSFEQVRDAGLARSDGAIVEANMAECELRLGRWAAMERRLHRLRERGDYDADMWLCLSAPLLALRARQGRLDDAIALAAEATGLLGGNVGAPAIAFVNVARVEHELLRGNADAARTIVHDTRRAIVSTELLIGPALLSLGIRAEADLAEQARAEGRLDEFAAARAAAEEILGTPNAIGSLHAYRWERPVAEPAPPETQTHWALGAAELSRLNGASGSALWADVATRWDKLQFPYPAAYARLREAEARLTGDGDRRGAALALRAAHGTLVRLGAGPLRDSAEALARRARIALPDPHEHHPPERPFDLTERELTVLEQLSAGHTNRHIAEELYLSPAPSTSTSATSSRSFTPQTASRPPPSRTATASARRPEDTQRRQTDLRNLADVPAQRQIYVRAMNSHLHQIIARDRIDERCHAASTVRLRREARATRPSRSRRLALRVRQLAGATAPRTARPL